MKEHPILFNTAMVKAILEGRKTQTRRVMRRQPDAVEYFKHGEVTTDTNAKYAILRCYNNPVGFKKCNSGWFANANYKTPFYEFSVGDLLWVRETWSHTSYPFDSFDSESDTPFYRADYVDDSFSENGDPDKSIFGMKRKWIPSIHMPRKASRILLEITNICVERLQDISESDCLKEGVGSPILRDCKKPKFMQLWESINGSDSWAANPWVWVIEFKVVEIKGALHEGA